MDPADPAGMKNTHRRISTSGWLQGHRLRNLFALLTLVALVAVVGPAASASSKGTSMSFLSPQSSTVSGNVVWSVRVNGPVYRVNFKIDNSSTLWSEWIAP